MSTEADATELALKDYFQRFMADPSVEITELKNPVKVALDKHFGSDSATIPTTTISFGFALLVCYQRAIEEFLADEGREHRVTGIRCPSIPDYQMGAMSISRVVCQVTYSFVPPAFCAPDYVLMPCGVGEKQPCLRSGLVLFNDGEGPGAIWTRVGSGGEIYLEVLAPSVERVDTILDQLAKGAIRLAPFRGHVVKITTSSQGPVFTFIERPRETSRDEVILPAGLLDRIERHSLGVVKAHRALRASGRHLKRGLLLHGRPGTGKTHTLKYLIGQMPGATVCVMSAGRMMHLDVFRKATDYIVPGVVILDDVDLIAEDRELAGHRYALFELLDVLDGIREDADLLFVMTTNRPNEIEPAVAARPGRIDQAIEVPLPDAECRSRLFDLYCDGVDVQLTDDERAEFLDRTDGVTAAFIREALRRATVAALNSGITAEPIPVAGALVLKALDDLLSPDNPLTPVLLGAAPRHAVPTIAVAPSAADAS